VDFHTYRALDLGIAADGVASGSHTGTLVGAKIGLTMSDVPIDDSTTVTALNSASATFTGYGMGSVTWGVPSVSSDGTVKVLGQCPIFRPTDGVTPNNIFDAYVTDPAGDLLFAGRFDTAPIPMIDAHSFIEITLEWLPETGAASSVVS
jgi:hypothetical protein